MIYVLYHANCYDGFGAAFAAWKRMGDQAKYIPVRHGDAPPEMPDAKLIYILDFSYSPEILKELNQRAAVTVIDHHKTAEEKLKGLEIPGSTIIFDMEKSGAYLAWTFFHAENPPDLIKHISDRDLWKFEIPGSKEIHSALVSYPFEFEVWDKFNVESLKLEGVACERFEKSVVDKICKNSFLQRLDDFEVPVVNTTQSWSEVGHALLEKYPEAPFVACFTVFKDQIMWSLRSRPNFDVSAIAKKYGGGGHAQAAGFKAPRP